MDPLKKVAPVKKIAANPFFKKFLGLEIWPYWVAIIVIAALAVLLVFLIKRRRAKKVEPPVEEKKEKPFPSTTLLNIWKEFLSEIPKEFRRSIMMYEPFVVLGESGVGKSSLIDICTDWQGQARQFYPSYTADPLLQIYLGSRVVVQEIPPALLNDTSKPALNGLRKLWKPLFRKAEPTVVVVLNSTALQSDTIESLKKHAQMIRGKINIISRLRRKPVKVCIALTHMDHWEGFLEFSKFLQKNNIPLNLRFTSKADLKNLSNCLVHYEDYLSNALTSLPATDFLKIISFLRRSPDLFSRVSVFTRILQSPDPLSPEPEVIRLSLVSEKEGDTTISNPFVSALKAEDLRRTPPLLKHQVAAAAIVVLGLVYLLSGYFYERHLLNKTDRQMGMMQVSPPTLVDYDREMHRLFLDFSMSLKKDPLLAFLPNFFPNFQQKINDRLVSSIRRFYLIPELKRLSDQGQIEAVPERTLYLLSIMCATNTNQLGELVLKNLREESEEWSKRLGLPRLLIEDYVTNNTDLRGVARDLAKLNLASLRAKGQPPDILPWLVYFRELRKTYRKPWMTKVQLQKLQKEAESGLELLGKLERYNLYAKFSELLDSELKLLKPSVDIDFIWIQRRGAEANRETIRQFLTFLRSLGIEYPPVKELSLGQLMENIRGMLTLFSNEPQMGKTFKFVLAGEGFEFNEIAWKELTIRSMITLSLRDFIAENERGDGLLFFEEYDGFEDILMNPFNEGRFLFVGKGNVEGRFTREAFDAQVKPALLQLPEFLDKLPIEKGEQARFRNFVFREVQAYADRYVAEWRDYYWDFNVKAESIEELRYVLTQMQLPSSPFQTFLMTVKENTVLEMGDNPYFTPLESKLLSFGFIGRVMEKRKDAVPELENYRAILAQMQRDLENKEPPEPENDKAESNIFEKQLSPLGRFFLAVLRGEKDSYLRLVEKWTDNVGIGSEYKPLFLEPFRQAYLLGRPEVEEKISHEWGELYLSDIQPLVTKFPFNSKAESVVSPADLETVLNPREGTFWKAFKIFMSPVCREMGGVFSARKCPLGSLRLSKDMLNTVNHLSRISKTLWDEKGLPKPLILHFKSFPLPATIGEELVAVLSYLKSGNSSAFGFNQKPAWQTFELEWWKEQPASAGLEFRESSDAPSIYKAVTILNTYWSFHRLLKQAEVAADDVLVWKVERPGYPREFLTVQFASKSDPWAVFKLADG
ncbi:MAG: ImcF-related family protein [Syntrophobacterales bacterium]|jgi:hypothetical protein